MEAEVQQSSLVVSLPGYAALARKSLSEAGDTLHGSNRTCGIALYAILPDNRCESKYLRYRA